MQEAFLLTTRALSDKPKGLGRLGAIKIKRKKDIQKKENTFSKNFSNEQRVQKKKKLNHLLIASLK